MTKSKDKTRVLFKIVALLIWVGASTIVSQLIVGYTMIFVLGYSTFSQPVWTAIFSALSYIVALILVIFVPPKIVAKRKNKKRGSKQRRNSDVSPQIISREDIGLKGTPTWTDIGLAPVGFFVYLLLATGITLLFSVFPWFNMTQAQDVGFSTFISGRDKMIAFFVLVVIAPIAEEILFRGWLYHKIRQKTSLLTNNVVSMCFTIFLVSLLFGIVHMQWNVGVNVFALSIVLCGLREVTGTIYASILLHMLKNGVAFYSLYVLGL